MAQSKGRDGFIHIPIDRGVVLNNGDALKIPDPFVRRLTSAEQNDAVFQTPVATLIDLWVEKYGFLWVDVDCVEQDPFYRLAYARLKALGHLEVHYLTDRSKYVCRKPE